MIRVAAVRQSVCLINSGFLAGCQTMLIMYSTVNRGTRDHVPEERYARGDEDGRDDYLPLAMLSSAASSDCLKPHGTLLFQVKLCSSWQIARYAGR